MKLLIALLLLLTSCADGPYWQVRNKRTGYTYYTKGWPAKTNCPNFHMNPVKRSTYYRYRDFKPEYRR